MTFPLRYTVSHKPFTGMTRDGMNNDVPAFGAPVDRKVYGWSRHRGETLFDQSSGGGATIETGYAAREIADIDLFMPLVGVTIFDSFTVDGATYQVVGVRDNAHGFHGWAPGIVVELKRVA